jgi:hypothetical protein
MLLVPCCDICYKISSYKRCLSVFNRIRVVGCSYLVYILVSDKNFASNDVRVFKSNSTSGICGTFLMDLCCHHHMVVEFATTYASNAYHH